VVSPRYAVTPLSKLRRDGRNRDRKVRQA
jgi:hypothetical protein